MIWFVFTAGLVLDLHRRGGGLKQDGSFQSNLFLATSFLAILAFIYFFEAILLPLTKVSYKKSMVFLVSFMYAMLFYYFKRVSTPFSYDILLNNSDAFYYLGTWNLLFKLIRNLFMPSDIFWSLVFGFLNVKCQDWGRAINFSKPYKRPLLALSFGVVAFVSIIQPYSADPLTNFLRSVYHFYEPKKNILSKVADNMPLLPVKNINSRFQSFERPHIFLVIVESFNSRFVNQKNEDGIEYAPYMNQLTRDHLYFKNYFSNSVQTAKGHFSALCGQINRMDGVAVSSVGCYKQRCLGSLMQKFGYQTEFIQADPNYNYDGNEDFVFKMAGFQKMPRLFKPCHMEQDKCYGLGVKDSVFYDRTFDYIDTLKSEVPHFFTLATVANHMPFNFMPEDERQLYKNPKSFKQHYLNSLRMVDDSLKNLIERYKKSPFYENSILLITGDHGFPTGEHGSIHNENYAYQENFGVPLLVIDSRRNLKTQFSHLEDKTYSHLNLSPSILDLAGINTDTDFIADSIFSAKENDDKVYLVQPYSGGYQAVIHWPYKYIFEEYRQRESVYDLSVDPKEQNSISLSDHDDLLLSLRSDAAVIYRQQDIYNCDKEQVRKNLLSHIEAHR